MTSCDIPLHFPGCHRRATRPIRKKSAGSIRTRHRAESHQQRPIRRKVMPIFEFICDNCGVMELIMSAEKAEQLTDCPNCNAGIRRHYSPPTFFRVFSGLTHTLLRRNEKGREPRVVRQGEGDPLEAKALSGCGHDHGFGGKCDTNYPPWMIKH